MAVLVTSWSPVYITHVACFKVRIQRSAKVQQHQPLAIAPGLLLQQPREHALHLLQRYYDSSQQRITDRSVRGSLPERMEETYDAFPVFTQWFSVVRHPWCRVHLFPVFILWSRRRRWLSRSIIFLFNAHAREYHFSPAVGLVLEEPASTAESCTQHIAGQRRQQQKRDEQNEKRNGSRSERHVAPRLNAR